MIIELDLVNLILINLILLTKKIISGCKFRVIDGYYIMTNFDINNTIWEPTKKEMREMSKNHLFRKQPKKKKTITIQSKKKFHSKDLVSIQPKTKTQKLFFENYILKPEQNFLLYGSAGTGKTFLGMYLGLKDVLDSKYENLIIIRSVVPSRDIGFIPGNVEEKISVYENPYISICNELFKFHNGYNNLKEIKKIKFIPTSFLRGRTLNNCVILVDEFQNLTFSEINTIITRVGYNSKIIFSGDFRQSDLLRKRNETSGFYPFLDIIEKMQDHFSVYEFGHEDIIRSGLVKSWIIKSEKYLNYE